MLNKILEPGYLFIESLVTVAGSRFVDVSSRFLHLGSVFESQGASSGENRAQAENDRAIAFANVPLRPHGVGNTRQLGQLVPPRNSAVFRSASPWNESAMFQAGLDCKIESGAISTRLAAADNLSEHERTYFEVVRASRRVRSG